MKNSLKTVETRKSSYLANPLAIFLIILSAYNIPPIISGLLLLENNIFFLSEEARSRENSIIFLRYFLIFFLSTSFFYYLFNFLQKNIAYCKISMEVLTPISMSVFYLAMILGGVLIANPTQYFTGYNTDPYAENNSGVNIVLFATEFIGSLSLINIFIKRNSKFVSIIALLIILIALGVFIVKMKRLELMVLILSFYLFYFRENTLKNIKYIVIFGLILGSIGAIRSELYNFDDILFFSTNSFILEANYSANSVFTYISNPAYYTHDYEFLVRILYTPLTLVPSGILDMDRIRILSPWPDYLIDYKAELSPGGAANLIGVLLFQGGVYGILLGSALIGLILSIYRKYLKYNEQINVTNVVFLISLCSFCLHTLRDSLFLALKLQLQIIVFLVVISLILKLLKFQMKNKII